MTGTPAEDFVRQVVSGSHYGMKIADFTPQSHPTPSPASIYVTTRRGGGLRGIRSHREGRHFLCTFAGCEPLDSMGPGSGFHHFSGLAGTGEPWHPESRIDSRGYCYSIPLLQIGVMKQSLAPPRAIVAEGEKAARCSCLL
ncbi:hypothetical protein LEMLEM_LOCUS24633 [Lemmus lemmus]